MWWLQVGVLTEQRLQFGHDCFSDGCGTTCVDLCSGSGEPDVGHGIEHSVGLLALLLSFSSCSACWI